MFLQKISDVINVFETRRALIVFNNYDGQNEHTLYAQPISWCRHEKSYIP